MILNRTYDLEKIWAVIYDETIWDCISEDGVSHYTPDVINEIWLSVDVDNVCIGLCRLHQMSGVTWQIHAFVLPEYRKEHSMTSGKMSLKWAYDNINLEKIILYVPSKYENVYKFTRALGFSDEGLNRKSFLKGGKLYDQHCLGITRDEIKEVI